jgi:hypothetical protein
LLLVRVGAWPSCQMVKAAPLPSVLFKFSWRLSWVVEESTVQKEVNWSPQVALVKSKVMLLANAGSGGQSVLELIVLYRSCF